MRVAILTISDAGVRGERADASGDAIAAWTGERGYALAARALVGDDTVAIVRQLLAWCDGDAADARVRLVAPAVRVERAHDRRAPRVNHDEPRLGDESAGERPGVGAHG